MHLTRREFVRLRVFVEWGNRVMNRTQILAQVWPRAPVHAQTVDVHVCRLRRHLERDPIHPAVPITGRGVGWKFNERAL